MQVEHLCEISIPGRFACKTWQVAAYLATAFGMFSIGVTCKIFRDLSDLPNQNKTSVGWQAVHKHFVGGCCWPMWPVMQLLPKTLAQPPEHSAFFAEHDKVPSKRAFQIILI